MRRTRKEGLKKKGVIKHVGIGVREHLTLRKFMRSGRCDVILTYLDYNLLHRTAKQQILPLARSLDIGVVNASAFYTGLLSGVDPSEKMKEGSGISRGVAQVPELVAFASRLLEWSKVHKVSLRSLALQFSVKHPAISTVVVGCRLAKEVDEIVDSLQENIPESIWEKFHKEWDQEISQFSKHWYFKPS